MSSMTRSVSAPLRARAHTRYASVLESALVGLGREDAVVQSTRKPRKKRRVETGHSPIRGLAQAFSAPERRLQAAEEEEEDPFAHLKLLKSHKKKKKRREETGKELKSFSPVVTRSAAKLDIKHRRRRAGVLEMMTRTPVTRSMMKKKKGKRSSLEKVEDVELEEEEEEEEEEEKEVVVQKKLSFQSPEPIKRKKKVKEGDLKTKEKEKGKKKNKKLQNEGGRVNRKAAVLQQWRVEWPPVLEDGEVDVERVQLVVTGQVDGESARFVVGKREGTTKFTSKEGQYVSLAGKFDRAAARSAGVPRAAMELIKEGIPAYFYKRLLPFVEKPQSSAKHEKAGSKTGSAKKKTSDSEKDSPPSTPTDNGDDSASEAPYVPSPIQGDDVFETPKPKKARAPVLDKEKKKDQPEPEPEVDVWTAEQLEALMDAKLKIPTTASNFWAQVAQYVPGKSAKDCQTKTFEQFRSPPTHRKPAKRAVKRANTEASSAIPAKIARAGSNKFKKQVREFVEEYEKKHVDDLFETTPSKEGLPELPDFGSIKSPELATPSHSLDEDSEVDDEAPGLLKKLSSRRRDDIDSYVLGINRQHVAGGGVMAGGKVRRVTAMVTPVKGVKAKAMSAKKKAVMLVEAVGSHSLKGIVSPGGTTHVRIEKDGSSSEGEDEDVYSSDEEEDFDLP